MREQLLEQVPEFDLIKDQALREMCLQTWEAAMEEGDWTLEALTRLPFTLLINPCPANFIEHTRAVTLTAVRSAQVFAEIYGERVPIQWDYLVAGALLHDIGKLAEFRLRDDGVAVKSDAGLLLRHPFTGMALAERFGLPVEVQHIIAAHAGEGDKVQRTTEATIVNHADFMNFHSLLRLAPPKAALSQLAK